MARGLGRLTRGRRREAAGRGGVEPLRDLLDALPLALRVQALTHSSWVSHRADSYGRLAFLGDSVLGLGNPPSTLFTRYPRSDIGRLTKVHGQAVSGRACAAVADALGVPALLREGWRPTTPRAASTPMPCWLPRRAPLPPICEALIETCLSASWLRGCRRGDGGRVRGGRSMMASERLLDFKSALQELLARDGSSRAL